MKRPWIKRAPLFLLIGIAGLFAFSGLVMLLWNNILPFVLHAGIITFWQAMGILVLSKILFSGFRGRRGFGHPWRRHLYERFKNMTPEERQKYKGCMHNWQMPENAEPSQPAA